MTLSKEGSVLEFQLTALYSAGTSDVSVLFKTFALAYDLGAMLTTAGDSLRTYMSIVMRHELIRGASDHGEPEGGVAVFGYQGAPYYELDALLSAGRRAYDKIGSCVWQAFERRRDGPNDLGKMLFRFRNAPTALVERLRRSWTDVGAKLKDYRDCTQHFTSTDIGMEAVTMWRIAPNVWTAWARIPDNPEVKSKAKFTYALGHDALTYGWEVANEVIRLAGESIELAHAVPPPRPGREAH